MKRYKIFIRTFVFLAYLNLLNAQQIPFDQHYYGLRQNGSSTSTNKPFSSSDNNNYYYDSSNRSGLNNYNYNNPNSYNPSNNPNQNLQQPKYYPNGTIIFSGNVTEYYSPDAYGFGNNKRRVQEQDNKNSQSHQPNNSVLRNNNDPKYFPPVITQPYDNNNPTNNFASISNTGNDRNTRLNLVNPNDSEVLRRGNIDNSYNINTNVNPNISPSNYPGGSGSRNFNYNSNSPFPSSGNTFGGGYYSNSSDIKNRDNQNYYGPLSSTSNPGGVGLGVQQRNYQQNYGIQSQTPYYPQQRSNNYQSAAYPGPGGTNYVDNRVVPRNYYPGPGPGRSGFDPGDPHRNIWNEPWSTTTIRPIAPGILGKWRPDLQGKQRPEDLYSVPEAVFVMTSYGRVQGFKVKLYDGPWVPPSARPGYVNVDKVKNTVTSFVGIPYARAPINEGRFRPPRPHPGWSTHQAVEFGPACPQPARFFGYTAGIVEVNEDCLYLNVYSPNIGSGIEGSPFPVIFYIHDGDFIHGGSQTFPPHQLVAWYKVVVVTVNFRLGSLGFLSTADEFSPGNYGMLDLSLALKWVNSNIRSFNGDPERITLVGLGSGAAAAGLLMLSPRTRGYVKNVVALEGAPTADWAAINDKYRLQNTTQLYSLKLGCWNQWDTTSWSMIQCLRTRSWQELANLELEPDVGTFPWSPAVDGTFKVPLDDYLHEWTADDWHFLPDSPENLLKRGEYPYVKYMTGTSRQAAGDLLYENKTIAPNYDVNREWFDQMIHRWVKKYNYTLNPEGVYSAIRYAYTYWPDPLNTTHLREEYINFLSDALYRAPIDQTVKLLLARGIQVHTFVLNYTLEGLRLPEWREVTRNMNYYLLAGAPFMDPEFLPERLRVDRSTWTESDRNMSNFLMSSVANMAHHGSPTPREVLGIYWERATPADLKYLSLNGTNNSTMQRNYRQRELTFWTEYMPFVVGRFVPTYPPTTEYWWEPNEPLQIAFWSVSGICLVLIVILVACCLLWRTTKKQRDRVYEDYGPGNRPLALGPLISVGGGDEAMSEYAASVKTADSLDSGVKLTHNPNPIPTLDPSAYSRNQTIHANLGAISQSTIHTTGTTGVRDKYPTPKRNLARQIHESPQTTV